MVINTSITEYLGHLYGLNRRPATLRSYRRVLNLFVAYARQCRITATGKLSAKIVVEYLAHRRGQGIMDTSLASERTAIVAWLNWLTANGYSGVTDWSKRVPRVSVDRREPKHLTPEEASHLFGACIHVMRRRESLVEKRDAAILAVLLDTGIREGELVQLRRKHVDIRLRSISIQATGKGRAERTMWYTKRTAGILREYLKHAEITDPDAPLWTSRYRQGLSAHRVYTIVRQIAQAAGLDGCTVHTLRHTFATFALDSGAPVHHVQAMLGHRNVATTMRYVHTREERVRQSYEEVSPMDRLASYKAI